MTGPTALPEAALLTERLTVAHLEITSKCNLRCTYCAVSQPDYRGYDLNTGTADQILDGLESLGVETVCLNGHGETTFHKDWAVIFKKVLGRFPRTELTTNLAVDYTDEEIDLLAQIDIITVSIDTHDPILLEETRRKVPLDTILRNMARLRQASVKHGTRRLAFGPPTTGHAGTVRADRYQLTPHFRFSCVVHDKNIETLPAFANFAVAQDVSRVVFCNLQKYDDIPGVVNVYPVTDFETVEELTAARDSLVRAEEILVNNQILEIEIQAGLLDAIDARIAAPTHVVGSTVCLEGSGSRSRRNHRKKSSGETRDCLDPWQFSIVYATGKVAPCCWHTPLHRLKKDESLSDVINNEKFMKLRKQLLTGSLNKFCKTCPARGLISTEELQEKLRNRDAVDRVQREKRDKETQAFQRELAETTIAAFEKVTRQNPISSTAKLQDKIAKHSVTDRKKKIKEVQAVQREEDSLLQELKEGVRQAMATSEE